jgi:hypothetical protein
MRIPPALMLTLLLAPADMTRADMAPGGDGPVLEVVTFRLAATATEAAFLTAAEATAAPLRRQPGFVARSLTRGEDGTWTDLVTWTSLSAAHAAAQAMMADPAFGPFVALIDPASMQMRHDTILWRMD